MDKNKIYQNYSTRAKYYGDEDIKKDLKRVKRVGTEVTGFCSDFKLDESLSREDADKLRAAGEVLRRLAAAMESLPARARKEKADHDVRSTNEENARLDKLAEGQEWAKDEATTRREAQLLGELLGGGTHVVEWLQHHLKRPEIRYLNWSADYLGESRMHLNVLRDPSSDLVKVKRSLAWVMHEFKHERTQPGEKHYSVTPEDFREWKAWKATMDEITGRVAGK